MQRFADCMVQVTNDVRSLHHVGWAHGDIKPGNLLAYEVESADEGDPPSEPRLLWTIGDFGLAAQLPDGAEYATVLAEDGKTLERRQVVAAVGIGGGTPVFSPPEQLGGVQAVGTFQDSFALAATMFEMIEGPGSALRAGVGVMCAPTLCRPC